MVEPAIGITAANISTLRPLFQRILGSKPRTPFKKKQLQSGDESDLESNGPRSPGIQEMGWDMDFAGLLGLEQTGVTTKISGGIKHKNHPILKLQKVWAGRNSPKEDNYADRSLPFSQSEKELKGIDAWSVEPVRQNSITSSLGALAPAAGWGMGDGIMKTTVTVWETK
jgi:hypothetical protein